VVVLVLSGGLLPAAIFIMKDFMDTTPRSYEESARVFGAGPLRILRDVVVPVVRPGIATCAVWTVVKRVGQLPHPVHPAAQPGEVAGGWWSATRSTPRAGSPTSA